MGWLQIRKQQSSQTNLKQPCQTTHRKEQWKMSWDGQNSMSKNDQWRLEPRVSHYRKRTSNRYLGHHARNPSTIVFPHIPEGVWVKSDLLGYVEKLKYSDHDVTDTDKFLEFTKKVYLQTVGLDAFGELVNQPL
jgi:hypothetical protein